ncbi:hypothetical protein E0H35_25680 [Rhizobium leguminosarum bv. viciae]|uniref:hypothetical protein n=1 Tax=Rhizobium leguminosarum TaxID=384 RepID=UPI00103DE6A4|nr:hypothetical protein [Rhizobium leguminosarum]TBY93587.1 hypothetical protein E0H35_25680 [Rhizobium leguminosarum bv. viciae]
MSEVKKILGNALIATRSASKQLGEGITSIRDHIRALKQQRAEVTLLPVTKEAALQRIDIFIRHLTIDAMSIYPQATQFARPDYRQPGINVAMLLAAQLGPRMADTLKADVERLYEQRPGITEEERVMRIREFDRKLLDAELTEESMIRAAETGGFPVLRRRDADPLAVLAHDKVLP